MVEGVAAIGLDDLQKKRLAQELAARRAHQGFRRLIRGADRTGEVERQITDRCQVEELFITIADQTQSTFRLEQLGLLSIETLLAEVEVLNVLFELLRRRFVHRGR